MKTHGLCPRCQARIELASGGPPPPWGRCPACGQGFLVLVPEPAPSGSSGEELELELELVPRGSERTGGAWLEARGLRRAALYAIPTFAAVFCLAVAAIALAGATADGTPAQRIGLFSLLIAIVLLSALPGFLLSALVARLLLERRGDPRSFWRSVMAMTAGAIALAMTVFVLPTLARFTWPSWIAVLVGEGLAGTAAGWVTMRLAPREPYRHVFGAAGVFTLGVALLMLPFGWLSVGAIFYLAYLPLLLLGAWIGIRLRASAAGTEPV